VGNPAAETAASSIERDLRRFLADSFPLGEDASRLGTDDSLLEAGIIDSTGVLELIGFLEERYGIAVPDEDLLPENLDTIGRIVRYLQSRGVGA